MKMAFSLLETKKYYEDKGIFVQRDSLKDNVLNVYLNQIPLILEMSSDQDGLRISFDDKSFLKYLFYSKEFLTKGESLFFKTFVTFKSFDNELTNLYKEYKEKAENIIDEDEYDPEKEQVLTEVERLTKQRKGQEIYRRRLEEYWDNSCAVTGIKNSALLRASHAKPWSKCISGSERLNPYNGFLLNVVLDALFDEFLISFDEEGRILLNPRLAKDELSLLGVNSDMKLRKISPNHKKFLEYHRKNFEEKKGTHNSSRENKY